MDTNKIYARADGGMVVKLFSSVFEAPIAGDVLVEEGNEDYHAHVHLKYQLTDGYGRYNYKILNGQMVEISEGEKPPVPMPPKGEFAILRETVDAIVISLLEG